MAAATGRKAVHTADMPTEQKPDLVDDQIKNRPSEIVTVDGSLQDKEYQDELAFMEEPVTIMIEPAAEKNAPQSYECWVNGKGAEVWDERNNRWVEMTFLPVAQKLTVKRKYVGVLGAAKRDNITTLHGDTSAEVVENRVRRQTSSVATFSVLHDPSPRGAAWLQELRRRNF